MNCAKRISVYAVFLGLYVTAQIPCGAKSFKTDKAGTSEKCAGAAINTSGFDWAEHSRLTWADFRGGVAAATDQSAAATYCSIGVRVSTSPATGQQEIIVYNTFYPERSWVAPDARQASILEHEQGHFDLCELYTRKLKDRINTVANAADLKGALQLVYNEVNKEYEQMQQAYEAQTIHGTNSTAQKKWQAHIAGQLQLLALK